MEEIAEVSHRISIRQHRINLIMNTWGRNKDYGSENSTLHQLSLTPQFVNCNEIYFLRFVIGKGGLGGQGLGPEATDG